MNRLEKIGYVVLLALGASGLVFVGNNERRKRDALDGVAAVAVFDHYDGDKDGRWSPKECENFYDDIGCMHRLPSGDVTSLGVGRGYVGGIHFSHKDDGTYGLVASGPVLRERAWEITETPSQ